MKREGIALVTTIMILLMLSLLAAGMFFTVKNEMAISTYQAHSVQVISVAESALDEIKHRMNLPKSDPDFIGDTSVPLNTNWKTVILFEDHSELDDSLTGTFYKTSLQSNLPDFDPENPEMDYTTKEPDSTLSLTVRHKTSEDGTQIYFYDSKTEKQFLGPPSLVVEYPPVEIVEITARSGKAVKKILAEISKQEVNIKVQSALSSSTIAWQMTGNTDVYVCGHNHLLSTPYNVCPFDPTTPPPHQPGSSTPAVSCWAVASGSYQTGTPLYHVEIDSCDSHPGKNHYFYNYYNHTWNINRLEYDPYCTRAGCLAGIATTSSSVGNYGATKSHIFGNPDIIIKYDITIPELYQVLGYASEAEMNDAINWETTLVDDPTTIRYFKLGSGLGSVVEIPTINSRTMGIIWINGSVRLRAGARNFQHKGLLYIQGDLLETSTPGGNYDFWVLGAMMVKGYIDNIHTSGNKRMFFMYSKDALTQTVEQHLRFYKLIGWKEVY
ncbi:MAG: hypothetical protein QME48_03245 [bacterium]|nr:hypothetical protein [bacterium]